MTTHKPDVVGRLVRSLIALERDEAKALLIQPGARYEITVRRLPPEPARVELEPDECTELDAEVPAIMRDTEIMRRMGKVWRARWEHEAVKALAEIGAVRDQELHAWLASRSVS